MPGKQRKPREKKKVSFSASVLPSTLEKIDKICTTMKVSRGTCIDALFSRAGKEADFKCQKEPEDKNLKV
jgi:hypothetical protein